MFKKVIISIILALTIICGANVAITTAFAAEEGETETVNYKVSYVSFAETFSGEYTANTPIVFKDGDNEVGVLKFDQSSVPGEISGGKSKFLSGTSLSFVPKNDYIVTKLVYTGEGFPSFKTSDTAHVTIEKPTSDEKALIKESFNVGSDGFAGALLDRTHVATEEDPYKCVFSSFAKLGAVFVIYEEKQTGNVGDITHDCTTDKSSSSPATVKVGDATFLIRYDGTFYGGYPARATGGAFSITIYPVPGNVINYVIFTSPTDNPLDTNELKFSEGLEATYDNGNLKVTGMQPGQTYTINSDGGAEGLLTSITVNYQEHEHSAPYTSGSDETYHFDQCVCLWRVNEEEHTFGEGTQTSEPTSKKPGTIEYTCSTCNYVKKEAVAPNLADTVVELTRKEFKYNGDGLVAAINNLYYKGENVSSSNYKRTGTTIAKTPGTYSFTIIPADGSIFVGEKVVTFTIEKGDYDMSKVVFEDMTVDYNGSAQSILATNLPKGVTVTYENNEQTDAGEYTIIAKFTLNTDDAQYYNPIENLTATLKINKASVAKPTADDTVFTYNGQEQTYVLETSDLYNVLDNTATIAGNHTVKVALVDKNNYQWENGNSNDIEYSFVINKATYNMDSVVFEDKTVIYNGSEFSIEATNLPNGVSATYENNEQTDAGEYTVTAKFTGDANNYELIANKTAVLTIKQVVVTAPIADDTAFTYNGQEQTYVLEASSLYNVLDNTATIAGNHTVKVALIDKNNYKWNNGNSNDLTYSFVINKATYNMEGVVFADKTVTYNGTEFSIEATNLPNGVSVTYENNGKTDAGEYVITAKFTGDANNYELIADKTAKLTINKATYNMDGVVFANKTVTYNGGAFSIEATNLPNGVTITYENNGKINVGEYTITAKFTGNANYNDIADKTATLTIEKAVVTVPTADSTAFTYNGQPQTYALQGNVLYTISNTTFTNAGSYNIAVTLKDKNNYKWNNGNSNDLTYSFVINKATYNMNGVVFANKTVVYSGSAFSIEATNLPNGVTVTYENNGKTDAGVYTVTAKFTGDADNYELITDKTATLTINKALISFDTNNEDDIANDIIISSNDGIDPTKELVVKLVESEKPIEDYKGFISKTQKVAVSYDVKLLKDGISVQPDGTLQFKVLIPAELVGKNFDIIHIHNGNEVSVLEYQIDGDYVTFESDKLSEFVFVYDMGSILWVIIVLGVVALLEIAFLVFLSKKNKEIKSKKLMSAYPPFLFGMFIAEWEIVLAIVLVVVVIVLAIVSIIFAMKVINSKTKTSDDEVSVTEETNSTQSVIEVEDEVYEKDGRTVKSFSERLSQVSPEINDYYSAIKGELSSFKGIKSKVSFKHESFRLGRQIVARLKIRGKSLYLYLALDPNDYKETKYKVKDMSEYISCQVVPTMYKINLPRRAEYGKKLIGDLMNKLGVEKN